MANFDPTQPQPAAANLMHEPQELSLASIVQEALADQTLQGPPRSQGLKIADRFIGTLVAIGPITDSRGSTKTPSDILGRMDVVAGYVGDPEMWPRLSTDFTRTHGLRDAVTALAQDERTSSLFGSMAGQLESTPQGDAFTSAVQIDAYLNALSRRAGGSDQDWGAMTNHIWRFATETRDGLIMPNPFRDRNMQYSNLQHRREQHAAFESLVDEAVKLGADRALLERSADEIRERIVGSKKAARLALLGLTSRP